MCAAQARCSVDTVTLTHHGSCSESSDGHKRDTDSSRQQWQAGSSSSRQRQQAGGEGSNSRQQQQATTAAARQAATAGRARLAVSSVHANLMWVYNSTQSSPRPDGKLDVTHEAATHKDHYTTSMLRLCHQVLEQVPCSHCLAAFVPKAHDHAQEFGNGIGQLLKWSCPGTNIWHDWCRCSTHHVA